MSPRIRCLLAAVCLAAGASLRAASPEAAPSAAGEPAAPLTLEECVRRAIENGFDLEIQRFNPAIARDAVDVARGSFIPTLSLTGSESHATTGAIRAFPEATSDDRSLRFGVSELLTTGTTVGVSTD